MKVGVHVPQFGQSARPEMIGAFAQAAEAAGFDSVWVSDHVVLRKEQGTPYPYSADGRLGWAPDEVVLEPLTLLTYVAGVTSRVQLGTSVLVLPMRQPVLHAKILATIDHLSGGRVILGAGLGWWKEEFAVMGMPFDHRGRRFEEYVQLLRALWREEYVNFKGEFYECIDWACNPKPVHGTIPIWFGGESRQQLTRAGRYGDGWHAGGRRAPTLRQDFAIVQEAAAKAGRDPSALVLSVRGAGVIGRNSMEQAAQRMAEFAELGVQHAVCLMNTAEVDQAGELLAEFGERHLPAVHAL